MEIHGFFRTWCTNKMIGCSTVYVVYVSEWKVVRCGNCLNLVETSPSRSRNQKTPCLDLQSPVKKWRGNLKHTQTRQCCFASFSHWQNHVHKSRLLPQWIRNRKKSEGSTRAPSHLISTVDFQVTTVWISRSLGFEFRSHYLWKSDRWIETLLSAENSTFRTS